MQHFYDLAAQKCQSKRTNEQRTRFLVAEQSPVEPDDSTRYQDQSREVQNTDLVKASSIGRFATYGEEYHQNHDFAHTGPRPVDMDYNIQQDHVGNRVYDSSELNETPGDDTSGPVGPA